MKRLQRLKKSLSLLLTFSMVISLFYGMVPVASAADTAGDYVTVHYENDGLSNKQDLTVVVKDPDGAVVETVEITDARLREQDISISLKDPYREIYDIKRVEQSGGALVTGEKMDADAFYANWAPLLGATQTFTIYLCKPLTDEEKPVVDGEVKSGMYITAPTSLSCSKCCM